MENKTGAITGMCLGYVSKFITQGFVQEMFTTIVLAILGATVGTLTQIFIKKCFNKKNENK